MASIKIVIDDVSYLNVPYIEGLFCSEAGELVSIARGYIDPKIKTLGSNGYEIITHRNKPMYVHRIVAQTYLPNPNNKPQVNHKNSIRSDNRLDNLEWCSAEENMQHSVKVGHMQKFKKPVIGVNVHDGSGVFYDSLMLAERSGFRQSSISMCLAGKQETHKGYRWELL